MLCHEFNILEVVHYSHNRDIYWTKWELRPQLLCHYLLQEEYSLSLYKDHIWRMQGLMGWEALLMLESQFHLSPPDIRTLMK